MGTTSATGLPHSPRPGEQTGRSSMQHRQAEAQRATARCLSVSEAACAGVPTSKPAMRRPLVLITAPWFCYGSRCCSAERNDVSMEPSDAMTPLPLPPSGSMRRCAQRRLRCSSAGSAAPWWQGAGRRWRSMHSHTCGRGAFTWPGRQLACTDDGGKRQARHAQHCVHGHSPAQLIDNIAAMQAVTHTGGTRPSSQRSDSTATSTLCKTKGAALFTRFC